MDGGGASEWAVEDFLEVVYGSDEGWIDLPARVSGNWQPFYHHWSGEATGAISARIDSCLRDGEDLYFSVGKFKAKGRREEDFLPSYWLWADLDEVHPSDATQLSLAPTLAWASSDGRYQCLWELDRELGAGAHRKLSQALSYFVGADPGGWDLTQVLRPPGTRNFKYRPAPFIRLMWYYENRQYDPQKVWDMVRGSYRDYLRRSEQGTVDAGRRGPLPVRARQLLKASPDQAIEGERSHRLWELECLLAENRWGAEAIFEVVSKSVWNKWSRNTTGDQRLRRDISHAIAHVEQQRDAGIRDSDQASRRTRPRDAESAVVEETPTDADLHAIGEEVAVAPEVGTGPFIRYEDFMAKSLEPPRWLVEDVWTEGAVGIIGGEPKTMKSTLALALAMSVASARPFLNKFPVHTAGPVLMVQEENSEALMQFRMQQIGLSLGLIPSETVRWVDAPETIEGKVMQISFPHEIPLYLLNNYGFDLMDPADKQVLWNAAMDVKPALVILDPLLMMAGDADLDKAYQVKPILKFLMELSFRWDCAVAIVHHFRKQRQDAQGSGIRPGQRVLGSTAFHGWLASGMYCERLESADNGIACVRVEREFREQAPQEPWKLEIDMRRDFETAINPHSWVEMLIELALSEGGGIAANDAADQLKLDRQLVISQAKHSGAFKVTRGGQGRGDKAMLILLNGDGS